MAGENPRKFYVGLIEKDKNLVGHVISMAEPHEIDEGKDTGENAGESDDEKDSPLVIEGTPTTFEDTLNSFCTVMESYREFIPFLLELTPHASSQVATVFIADFVKKNGLLRADLSTDKTKYYEIDLSKYRSFTIANERVISAIHGAQHLPEIMLIGLVSAYDAFLSRLLRIIFHMHEEVVMTSDKQIRYSELISYDSIEAAKQALIDNEIESVIRLSHHDQFAWMERKFDMTLKSRLDVWPRFIELCERRNLVTHTGGIVSRQYLTNCREYKADIGNIKVGDKLKTNLEYYEQAVLSVYEVGIKLGHVMWRKFDRKNQIDADAHLNETAFNLIFKRQYQLAERLLEFGTEIIKNHPSDKIRRMMVINRANCFRLMDKKTESKKLLDKEDWSATSVDFQISVAAASEDIDTMIKKMRQAGAAGPITMEDYRTWPLFRGHRLNELFMSTFREIFGVPIVHQRTLLSETVDAHAGELPDDIGTVH